MIKNTVRRIFLLIFLVTLHTLNASGASRRHCVMLLLCVGLLFRCFIFRLWPCWLRAATAVLRADSAMALLRRDSVMLVHAPKPQRMAYILSKTEAEDKLYITHRSDSAMQLAVKYFDRHGSALQRTRAWYLLGRVYCDMLLYGNALTAFDAAIAVQPDDDSTVCRYKARACSWAGSVYEEKELHKDALRYNKMSYDYAHRCDVPSIEVFSLRDIGRSYSDLAKDNVAIPYYLHAAGKADSLNNSYLYNMVMEELASIYIENGMSDSARWALSAPFCSNLDEDLSTHYFVLADYYELIRDLDSAIICNKEGLKYSGYESTMTVSLDLARLLERVGKHEEAEKYYAVYNQYKDSVEADRVVQNNNLLGFVEKNITVERQNVSLAEDKTRLVTLVLFIVVVVAVAAVMVMRFYNKRKIMYERQQEGAYRPILAQSARQGFAEDGSQRETYGGIGERVVGFKRYAYRNP